METMTYQQQITVNAKGHGHMHDLTGQVAAIVSSSGIKRGIAHIFNVGSTAAVGTIEFEPGLEHDLPAILDRLIPQVGAMGTSRPGTMAMDTRTCRPPCLVRL